MGTDNGERDEKPADAAIENKMEALSRLAGGVAHDMNNILGAIEGYATLSQRGLDPSEPLRADLEEIRKAVAKGSALMKKLLSFSRRQALNKSPLKVDDLLAGLAAKGGEAAGPSISVECRARPGLPALDADPRLLERLFMNLILNARDAMPSGGTISVRAEAAGPFVRISVSDQGTGMPPSVKKHLFEPFFTTKEKGKGIGLGLAETYGIARQHGGRIEASTAEGKGSVFSVLLPAAGAPGVSREAAPSAEPVSRRASVLVVEDDEDLRNMALKALSSAGFLVSSVPDLAGAFAALKKGGFDVIFSDIILPDGDVTLAVPEMRALAPRAAFIFTSGYMQSEAVTSFLKTGGYAFLIKPYAIDALLAAIRRCRGI
ncbi:MAG: ATP-binding protein [Elusimicrobia bacterium]|nr:ATP-binding protein [Elusimicrobiota bacterium]